MHKFSGRNLISLPGMDGIPPKFAKLARSILFPYFAKLFNKCIEPEIFPRDFEGVHVIPIPKTSFSKSLNKFCPNSKEYK